MAKAEDVEFRIMILNKVDEWVKIGETTKPAPFFRLGIYARYAVMELIKKDGNRKYKEVLMCTWTESAEVKSQTGITISEPTKQSEV